jgi:CubicO group peptidase (beta-lactamase class C family)
MEDRQQEFFCRTKTKTGEIIRMKKYQAPKSFLILLCIAFAWNNFYGQTNEADAAKQIDQLFSAYNATTPGVAVAVVKDGKVIFKKGYGTANLEYDQPITTRTVFNLASVSKQFTAFAIYLLEKQGKLSLEDDVRKYVSEVPDLGKTVRIKHLLAHTSGVRDHGSLMTLAGVVEGDSQTTDQILRLISRQKELNFDPGSEYLYNNSGYALLAEVVERISGQTFSEFTKKNIFEPLKMNDTQFYDDYEKIVKNRADSYELTSGVYKKKGGNHSSAGPSNLYTTVEDMAKWVWNFETPVVGDADLIKRFNEPSLLNNGERVVNFVGDGEIIYHAKGQNVRVSRGVNVLSHGGHAFAFRPTFWRYPDQRFAVILLSNDEHFEQLKNAQTIIELYLKGVLQPKQAVTTPVAPTPKPIEKNVNLKDFEGRFYSDEVETAYLAKVVGGKLFFSHIRHGEIELTETGKDKFSARFGYSFTIEFDRNETRAVTRFRISNFGAKNVKFNKKAN